MLFQIKEYFRYALYKIRKKQNKSYTNFAPLTITPEYTNIDKINKNVTGVIKHENKIYLTVVVDVVRNKATVKGSLRGISHLTKPFNKRHYIEIIQSDDYSFFE
ncbi:hypothetical protein [Sutcliffiella rhizosphaerae]|uniref:Transposase n=1 Tax=Sutcliffiella rhizosphaerae TaxID=2880967 RepID=A0ABN8A991_9BACI|nr:hypothetical protein [Sutcliffiella rhizosphaerae]CAG9621289.1 hypothetical protein BACCIP111883_02061 [Sutcliffiella rhizosphaerae]